MAPWNGACNSRICGNAVGFCVGASAVQRFLDAICAPGLRRNATESDAGIDDLVTGNLERGCDGHQREFIRRTIAHFAIPGRTLSSGPWQLDRRDDFVMRENGFDVWRIAGQHMEVFERNSAQRGTLRLDD